MDDQSGRRPRRRLGERRRTIPYGRNIQYRKFFKQFGRTKEEPLTSVTVQRSVARISRRCVIVRPRYVGDGCGCQNRREVDRLLVAGAGSDAAIDRQFSGTPGIPKRRPANIRGAVMHQWLMKAHKTRSAVERGGGGKRQFHRLLTDPLSYRFRIVSGHRVTYTSAMPQNIRLGHTRQTCQCTRVNHTASA